MINDSDSKPTAHVISRLQDFLGQYEILDIKREEEMYIQIAEVHIEAFSSLPTTSNTYRQLCRAAGTQTELYPRRF